MSEPSAKRVSNLVDLLRWRSGSEYGDLGYTFLEAGEEVSRLSFFQLERRARSIAAALAERVAPGERALLLYPPGQHYLEGFFGCLFAGVVPVPVYPPSLARPERTLPRVLEVSQDSGASVLLTLSEIQKQRDQLASLAPELAALEWMSTDDVAVDPELWKPWAPEPDQLCFLQYTSGSTRSPRGVIVSHANLLHNSAQIHDRFGHSSDSRGVSWLPPYHDMGLIGGLLQPLYGGFPVAVMSPTDFIRSPRWWLEAITRYGATTSGGPNFAFELCLRRIPEKRREGLDLSTWSLVFCGAEPLRPGALRDFLEAFEPYGLDPRAFFACYGLAESTLMVSGGPKLGGLRLSQSGESPLWANADPAPQRSREIAMSGRVVDGLEVRIVDPETRSLCPEGAVGEIWVRGPSVCCGYWERPEESEATFGASLSAPLDDGSDGHFLRTGDLGHLSEGELVVSGRLKEAFTINGRNHYPHDLEYTAAAACSAIRSGCLAAFALEADGRRLPVVVAELEPDAERQVEVLGSELAAGIRRAILDEHEIRLESVVFVKRSMIPKTSSGKLRRLECAQLLSRGVLEPLFADGPGFSEPLEATGAEDATGTPRGCRVDREGCPSRPPSDPYVRNSRIRLLGS